MRRITVVLDVGLETDSDGAVDAFAHQLVEDIEFMLPYVSLWRGEEKGWDSADVKRAAVARASEQ
jgi:hypothetical protein